MNNELLFIFHSKPRIKHFKLSAGLVDRLSVINQLSCTSACPFMKNESAKLTFRRKNCDNLQFSKLSNRAKIEEIWEFLP